MADDQRAYEELLRENKSLKQEVKHYKRNAKVRNWVSKRLFSFGKTIFLGRDLDDGLKKWLAAAKTGNLVPTEETANVLAAIIRRSMGFYIIAILGTLGALSTTGLLIWQNTLFQRQLEQQRFQDTLTRRAQLVQILYDKTCVDEVQQRKNNNGEVKEVTVEVCTPVSDTRSRAEAAKVFIALERDAGVERPDLSRSLLSNTDLQKVDFRGVNLAGADLSEANLNGANLSGNLGGANFRGADLSEANLSRSILEYASFDEAFFYFSNLERTDLQKASFRGAELYVTTLSGAFLIGADFSRAILDGVDFSEAELHHANFSSAQLYEDSTVGTDFSEAVLNGANFQGTAYDGKSVFPESFELPEGMCFFEHGNPNNCQRIKQRYPS